MSDEFVTLVLDDAYAGAAPILKVLSIVGLIAPLYYFRNSAFTAIGLLDKLVKFCSIDVAVATVLCLVMVNLGFGLTGAVSTFIGVAMVQSFLTTPVLLKEMHTKPSELISKLVPAYVAAGFMALVLLTIKSYVIEETTWMNAIGLVFLGVVFFFGFLIVFFKKWFFDGIAVIAPSVMELPRVKKLMG